MSAPIQQLLQLAADHLRNRRWREAIELLEHIVQAEPQLPQAYAMLAQSYQATGQFDVALASMRRLAELAPNSYAVQFNLANALRRVHELSAAETAYRTAIHLKSDFFEAYENLGCLLAGQQRYADALPHLTRAQSLRQNDPTALANLGDTLKQLGRVDEAIAVLERAVALQPANATAHANLGGAYREQGRLAESIASLRRAVELNPAATDVHSNLVYTLWYHDMIGVPEILKEHRAWDRCHAEPRATISAGCTSSHRRALVEAAGRLRFA